MKKEMELLHMLIVAMGFLGLFYGSISVMEHSGYWWWIRGIVGISLSVCAMGWAEKMSEAESLRYDVEDLRKRQIPAHLGTTNSLIQWHKEQIKSLKES